MNVKYRNFKLMYKNLAKYIYFFITKKAVIYKADGCRKNIQSSVYLNAVMQYRCLSDFQKPHICSILTL